MDPGVNVGTPILVNNSTINSVPGGDDCKFCVVHIYGVYILNLTTLLIVALVLFFYWRDILAYFNGTAEPKVIPTEPPERTDLPADIPLTMDGVQDQAMSPDVQFADPPQTMLMPTPPPPPLPPPLPPPPPPPPAMKEISPQFKDFGTTAAKKSTESTGSNYYKQMLRGKKPVASISQYQLLKKAAKKGRGKQGHGHHIKNKTHSRKINKETELKKFNDQAKKLTKGFPS